MNYISTKSDNFTGTIVLNNDKKHNSLNFDMLEEINEALDTFEAAEKRVVVIKSNPEAKVWCAGLRIDQLPEPDKDPVPFEYPLEKTLQKIENYAGVVIALIEGSVWGGGCELAFACDILIGTPGTTFAITPAKLNAPYNLIQVQRVLNFVTANIARELFFTAEPIQAKRALELGILNRMVAKNKLEHFASSMIKKIVANAPLSIRLLKKEIHALNRNIINNIEGVEGIKEEIKAVYYSSDYKEGRKAFLEKREPQFYGN